MQQNVLFNPYLTNYNQMPNFNYPQLNGMVQYIPSTFMMPAPQMFQVGAVSQQTQAVQQPAQKYEVVQDENGQKYAAVTTVADGKDDGKISFGRKLLNFGKGCLKFVTGLFTDKEGKFSIGQTLKTVGIVAAAVAVSVATAGTAAAPALAAAGVALGVCTGGVKIVKGAVNASKATTDAEAEAAWQDIGLGATTVAVSVAGAKGAMKSVNGGSYSGNCIQATKDCFVTTGKNVISAAKNIKTSAQAGTLLADAGSLLSSTKTNFVTNAKSMIDSTKSLTNFNDKSVANIDKQIAKLDITKDAEKIAELTAQKESLLSRLTSIESSKSPLEIESVVACAKDKVEMLKNAGASKAQIASAQSELKAVQTAADIKFAVLKEAYKTSPINAGSQVAVTAKEGKAVIANSDFTSLVKHTAVESAKYNPFKNVDETGSTETVYYAM